MRKVILVLLALVIVTVSACSGDPAYVHVDNPLGIIGYGGPVNWLGDLAEEPGEATLGDAYHNTVDGITYFYDGDSWEILAAPGEQGDPGEPGGPGTPGEPGADGVSFIWRGTWDSETEYVVNDVANNTGSSWICIENNTNEEPPNPTYWELMAQKGDIGLTGATGATGGTGAQGIPGPNQVDTNTNSTETGIVAANGTKIYFIALTANATDYLDGTGNFTTFPSFGDMLKSVYDADDNGAVTLAEGLANAGPILIKPNGDTDDYVSVVTTANRTAIVPVGGYLVLGADGTPGSATANGDVYIKQALEVDGAIYADGAIHCQNAGGLDLIAGAPIYFTPSNFPMMEAASGDANANSLDIGLRTGSETYVPAIIISSSVGQNWGLFDGLTQPITAIIEKARQLHSATNGIADAGAATAILKHVGGFTNAVVGDIVRITAGTNCTPGWYWITTVTSANQVTLDRNYTTGDTTNVTFVTYHDFSILSAEGVKTRVTDGAPTDASVELDMDGWIILDANASDLYWRANGVWDSVDTHINNALEGYTETDPIYSNSTAAGIDSGNVTNWDTAYGWGDHSIVGYLTEEGDPIVKAENGIIISNGTVISSIPDNSTDWDTAYDDRLKWDGGSTDLNAATARTSLELGTAAQNNTGDFQPAGTYVTSVTGTSPIVSSGGTTPAISVLASNDTQTGTVELATAAETTTGTDATRAVTPDGLAGSDYGKRICEIKLIDDATAIAANAGNFSFCIPVSLNGYNLVLAHAFVTTQSSSGTPTYMIINVTDSVNMLSTAITIDANNNEYTSYTAATPPVIDAAHDDVATGDIIKVNKTVAGTGEKGDGVILSFQLP